MIKKLKEKSGETLVEVLASMFIFLILFGILQGAVSYSHASMQKNKQIREENAQIIQGLASAQKVDGDSKTLSFIATTSEMDKKGSVVFRVPFTLATKTVTYQDTNGQSKNIVFSLYDVSADASVTPSEGGDAP